MITINWTIKAQLGLNSIYDYIYQDAPFYAKRFVQQIIASVDRLEAFPLSGRRVPEADSEDIREIIFHNYRLIYWVINDERVDILGVLHGSCDLRNAKNQPWNIV